MCWSSRGNCEEEDEKESAWVIEGSLAALAIWRPDQIVSELRRLQALWIKLDFSPPFFSRRHTHTAVTQVCAAGSIESEKKSCERLQLDLNLTIAKVRTVASTAVVADGAFAAKTRAVTFSAGFD